MGVNRPQAAVRRLPDAGWRSTRRRGAHSDCLVSLAGSSKSCIQATANKARVQGIASGRVMETVHIVRFPLSTEVIGDAAPVLDELETVR